MTSIQQSGGICLIKRRNDSYEVKFNSKIWCLLKPKTQEYQNPMNNY